MDALYLAGQMICLAALAYGAFLCLMSAGRYGEERPRCSERTSPAEQVHRRAPGDEKALELAA